MHLTLLPVLWPQIRIIRCIQTSGTRTRTRMLSRFMFPSLSCLYHIQLVLLVSSAALSGSKLEGKKKKQPSTLINQTWAFRGPQLPIPSSTLSSFRFPSNPISNSPFWQLKMGWWKLCKCALFVMLFFCIHPHHVFLTLQSRGAALALVQKGDSCAECLPGALTGGSAVRFSELVAAIRGSAVEKVDKNAPYARPRNHWSYLIPACMPASSFVILF